MKRIGVIGIVITNAQESVANIMQTVLSEYGDIIIGRMGVPIREDNINTISIIVKGSNERISALTGKLGRIDNLKVKSVLTSVEVEE
jgi:putative iron-only hydrogenase system regulator